MTVTVIEDESALQNQLQKAGSKLIVIDFTAVWCGPCKQMAPYFEELSKKYPSTVFLKVDVDDNSEIAMQYEVSAMPTFLFIRKQKELDRVTGADPVGLENRIHSWGGPVQATTPPPPLPPTQQQIQQQQQQKQQLYASVESTGANQNQNPQIKLGLSPPAPSGNLNTNNLPPGVTMVQPQQVQGNYNNLNMAAIQQQQQLQQQIQQHQSILLPPNYPQQQQPPSNYYSQQQQPPPQQIQQFIVAQQPLSYANNANSPANVISAKSQQQYADQDDNNAVAMAMAMGQIREMDDVDLEENENEARGELTLDRDRGSSHRNPAKTLSSSGKVRRRSNHRTKSTHRKDSHQSSTSSSNNPQSLAKMHQKESEGFAQKALRVKKKLPTANIQIRLADGTKMTASLNTTQPISKIREFILNARPAYANKSFVLMTIFPSREITNEEQSIQDAKLQNSMVIQRLT